jgi:hypothetical protein
VRGRFPVSPGNVRDAAPAPGPRRRDLDNQRRNQGMSLLNR